ncbi:MAG TPA: galactokinase family protein [Longimicrobiales bacterium]|nr:galactokinase family protein [Longimicrobiales bacterium]
MPVSFAPGRVNLIGEHVDYHGLPVLPMALSRGVRVDFTPRDDGRVILRNAEARFGERSFPLSPELAPGPGGDWGNYAMAAAVTVADRWGASVGIRATVTSDLPSAAGLSSSSALVVAVAQALLHASQIRVDPLALAEALAEGEHFVGTSGGGMDQAASLLGRAGHAVEISFRPLAVAPVPFPDGWRVVVAHSGVSAEKSGSAQAAYNQRRAGSADALGALAEALGVPGMPPRELLTRYGTEALLSRASALPAPGGRWAVHTLSEAARVERAVVALGRRDLPAFGELLDASHASLRDVYEVSHPRLDALVEAARAAGAVGARLTGAGFGGCMLAVCAAAAAPQVVEALAATQEAMDPPPEISPFLAFPGEGAHILGE